MHQEIKVALHTCWPEASSERPPKSPIKLGLFVWFQSPQFPIVKSAQVAQDTCPRNVDILLLLLRALTVVFLHGGLGCVVVVLEFLHLSLQKHHRKLLLCLTQVGVLQ